MSEAHIVINGFTLSSGQEMALGYAGRLREVFGFIIHVQQRGQ